MFPWGRRGRLGRIASSSVWIFSWAVAWGTFAPALASGVPAIPASTFAVQLHAAQELATACSGSAAACSGASLPGREQVTGAPGGTFNVSWEWLRDELSTAKTASAADRNKGMQAAARHLSLLASQAEQRPAAGQADVFNKARVAANTALARGEFRAANGPTWIQRQFARVQDWFLRLFTGMDRLGKRAPWLAPLIEWGCFALAAAGLLWFVRQSLARQALRISLSEGATLAGTGLRDATDWSRFAQERADAGDWREAIHCLYWAAIALMEGRRAWKPNATRTPREYVRLLKGGSGAQTALRDLTRSLERVWYGNGTADAASYGAALQSFRALEGARPERPEAFTEASASTPHPVAGGA